MAPCLASVLMIILLILGMRLVITGWRTRCDIESPHCRRCGYNLTGLTSQRCPECGNHISPETTVLGWRRADLRRVGRGALLVGIAAAVFGGSRIPYVRDFSSLSLRPTATLLEDLTSAYDTTVSLASRELLRRESRLEADELRQIAVITRDRYVSGKAHWRYDPLHIWLRRFTDQDLLTADDFRQIVEAKLRFELRGRTKHARHDPFPFEVAATSSRRSQSSLSWVVSEALAVVDVRGDGRSLEHTLQGWRENDGRQTIRGVVHAGELAGNTLQVRLAVNCYDLFEVPVEIAEDVTVDFEIVATPEEALRLRQSPELDASMQQVVQGASARSCSGSMCLTVDIETGDAPPIDCAFEVVAVDEDEEHALGPLLLYANGKSGGRSCLCKNLGKTAPDSVDILLRSSRERACETFDMVEIWGGELVFPGVEVQHTD